MHMITADLVHARQFHEAGRYADAARCYDALLARRPDDAEALHLFGVMHHQCGYSARAVELIGRAVALRPEAAAYHANLAEAHRAIGQNEPAIDCCRTALRLQPDYPEAANNLGLALHALGRYPEAVEQFREALRMRPGFAMAQNNLGTSLLELGQKDDALEAFRAAAELDPEHALARSNLGQLLVDRGQAEEGLPHCQEAARLQPGLPASYNNLGNAYRALERWDEARAAYGEALALASREHPRLQQSLRPEIQARIHANLGFSLQLELKKGQAIASFRRAAELAPEDAQMWRTLGNACAAVEDYAEALPCYQKVVALRPRQPLAHNDLGWALQEQGRLADATSCYRRALELQPNYLDALLNLGFLDEEQGDMAAAEAWYRRGRAAWPRLPGPLARLAMLLRGKLPEAERQAIRNLLDDPRWADAPARGPLLFGLAHVLDASGDYARAAACLAEANAWALQERRQQGRNYDHAWHVRFIDRLIAGFNPELFARLSAAGDPTRQPVFVFGMPRSGTTLVEQVLASHSRVHGAGELCLARESLDAIPALLNRSDDALDGLPLLQAEHVRQLSRRHLDGLDALVRAGREPQPTEPDRIVDKMPDNYLYVGLLALLFPRATFIHVRRDPRDVAVSCWMTNFRSIRWADDPDCLAGRIREYRRLWAHWQAVLPVPVHEVVYEELVDDFETEARRLVSACGLEWEPACLEFHQTKRPVRTASVTQVRQPLYRRSLARWKNYEADLADLFARLPAAEENDGR
jgi:tetratricopeptide (TPR) repeat protein